LGFEFGIEIKKTYSNTTYLYHDVREDWPIEWDKFSDAPNLAGILVYILARDVYQSSFRYEIEDVLKKIKNDLKTNCVILHLDKFQKNLKLIHRLMSECREVFYKKLRIFIYPIFTGLSTIGLNLNGDHFMRK